MRDKAPWRAGGVARPGKKAVGFQGSGRGTVVERGWPNFSFAGCRSGSQVRGVSPPRWLSVGRAAARAEALQTLQALCRAAGHVLTPPPRWPTSAADRAAVLSRGVKSKKGHCVCKRRQGLGCRNPCSHGSGSGRPPLQREIGPPAPSTRRMALPRRGGEARGGVRTPGRTCWLAGSLSAPPCRPGRAGRPTLSGRSRRA